jgi:steroid delta-isomerase-like uncharacterized protein
MRWFSGLLSVVAGLVLSLTFATIPFAHAQDASPAASHEPCPATSPEENKALVERYWAEVWTAGGAAVVAEVLTPEEVHHWGVGGDTVGPAAFTERLTTFLTAFPDFAIQIQQLVAEDDLVVSYYTATGTQQGEWLGIQARGAQVEYTGFNLFRISCGQIAESWGEADHLGLLRQIGGLPDLATPAAAPAA